jgi:hypothetical protein
MRKTSSHKTVRPKKTDELRREYRLDYAKARPNRFAPVMKSRVVTVVLDEDVASVFRSTVSVNKALRSIILAFPKELRS